jgi:hypothetical protein
MERTRGERGCARAVGEDVGGARKMPLARGPASDGGNGWAGRAACALRALGRGGVGWRARWAKQP